MRHHMTEGEIDKKLAEIELTYDRTKSQAEKLETEAKGVREEMCRIQGDYRTWASLKEEDKKIDTIPASPEAASV